MTAQNATPGRGYIYVEMNIKDPEGFKQYTALSAPAVHAAGGRYIVRGVRPEFLEGTTNAQRIVIVEFDTAAQARPVLPLGGLSSGAPEEAVGCGIPHDFGGRAAP